MTNLTIIAEGAVSQVIDEKITIAIATNAAVGSGNANATRLKVPFSWGDATPKLIGVVQGFIKRASIIIVTPFNSPSVLTLGDDLNLQRLITTGANNPLAIAEYETSPIVNYVSATEIKLAIALGMGNTQGSGFVILEV